MTIPFFYSKQFICLFSFLIIHISIPCKAQNRAIDSLDQLLLTLPDDTAKVGVLNELAWEWLQRDIQEMKDYAEEALELSEKLSFPEGIAIANRYRGIAYIENGDFSQGIELFLGSLATFEKLEDDFGINMCAYDLSNVYADLGDYENALHYLQMSLERKEGDEYVSYTYGQLSSLYDKMGNKEESEKYWFIETFSGAEQIRLKLLA